MNRTLLGTIVGVVAGVALATPVTALADDEPATDTGYWGLSVPHYQRYLTTPCQYEDSVGCYWDARTMGNGEGHSFYAIPIGHKVCIQYWNRKYNRHHGSCYPR
jgi:hypothetical protein